MKSTVSLTACTSLQQTQFLGLLPRIVRSIRFGTRGLPRCERQEACQELTVQAFVGFLQLCRRNLSERGFATTLVRYALMRYRSGRRIGQSARSIRPMDDSRGRDHEIPLDSRERVVRRRPSSEPWLESLQPDRRTPVADQVCFRMDFDSWYASLLPDKQSVIDQLSIGCRPSEVAENLKISRARISQIRQELQKDWEQFVGTLP